MIKRTTMVLALVLTALLTQAQTFAPGFVGFSVKKTTYITMNDGSEVEGRLKKLSYKKGLVEEIKIEDASTGKKVKIKPEDIKFMYVPPSNMGKLAQKIEASNNLSRLIDGELSSEHLNDGYLYMESSKVQLKKKTGTYMLQLANPTFSAKIKVYIDPFAKQSAGIGVGGMTLAGGLDKSYYIKKATEDVAQKITKKEYKKEMALLFAESPELLAKYNDDPKWSEFEKFIYEYSTSVQ
ncbi:hypothetical protein R9C00_25165 [Flammeovirgaceae bacterium SG7u.111]|nr:hypothetical protein [Flammeovirgaceae bacterium SG7u.132]WPO34988.1 hypothetical protein R9C00_25165 [Flammeovirgaceae bacterium SG7u.111]